MTARFHWSTHVEVKKEKQEGCFFFFVFWTRKICQGMSDGRGELKVSFSPGIPEFSIFSLFNILIFIPRTVYQTIFFKYNAMINFKIKESIYCTAIYIRIYFSRIIKRTKH